MSCVQGSAEGYGWAETTREGNEVKEREGSRPWRKAGREEREGRAQSVQCRLGCAEQDGGRETHGYPQKKKLGEISFKIENVGAEDGAFTGLKHLET